MPDNKPEATAAPTTTPITPGQSITPNPPTTSTLAVTVANTIGVLKFQLVVTDNLGQQSAPAVAQVTVQGPPIAVINATPPTVAEGGAITLDGSQSTSSGTGTIASYTFTLEALPT
jgi:hypothetical protein